MTAHITFHFALGMMLAAILAAPRLIGAWRRNKPMNTHLALWTVLSLALGVFAVFPSILHRLGAPESVLHATWANLFLLFPWINRTVSGGMIIGEFMIVANFAAQYIVILLAIFRARKQPRLPRLARSQSQTKLPSTRPA